MNSTGSPPPGFFSETLGLAAYAFSEVQPYLPMYIHLILSALFPIFTGAHASLVRPSSAAKPKKKAKKEAGDDDEDEDDDDDDESIQKMEGLSNSDAVVFPVLAGSTLAGLYFLIKWAGADMINKILGWYFSSIAVFSVAKLLNDGFSVLESFCWPKYYVDEGVIWHVKSLERRVLKVCKVSDHELCSRTSPLPGIMGRIRLPLAVQTLLWHLRDLPSIKFTVRAHFRKLTSFKLKLTLRTIVSIIFGLTAVVISNFVSKAWWLTNLQGFAFSYNALQLMSPTTFGTGSLILSALFFYDIYFVFYTPMMVTVATKLDVPIKLLFPRPAEEGEKIRKLAMLGLGDIVLPGIMIGLALRFDLWMHYLNKQTQPNLSTESSNAGSEEVKQEAKKEVHRESYQSVTGHWGNSFWTSSWTGRSRLLAVKPLPIQQPSPASRRALIPTFRKPYFCAAVGGYIAGMCVTLGIMQVFHHAQPALLYLVPGVLISLWGTGAVRGELKQMREFSEAEEVGPEDENAVKSDLRGSKREDDKKSSWWSKSFFSSATTERNAKLLEKSLAKSISEDKPDTDETTPGRTEKDSKNSKIAKENKGKETNPGRKGFFGFSITREPTRSTKLSKSKREVNMPVNSEEAIVVGDADVSTTDRTPRWRGSRVSVESKEERPEKRLRTS